jgi:peptide/nickel transport system substrate-binding protein
MAIDRQEIIDALLFGQATPATSTVPPWHPLYPSDIAPAPYDLEGAKRLLEQEGWRDTNGDGIREKNGKQLAFTINTSDASLNRSIVEVVQAHLRRAGVNAQVRPLEFQTLLTQWKGRDFDAVFGNWVLDNFQMASAPAALFHSKLANVPKSTNRSGVNIPALDRLIDQASAATSDSVARPIWRQMTEVLQREQPVTLMFWLNELAAASNEVENVKMDPRGELLTMRSWAVKK